MRFIPANELKPGDIIGRDIIFTTQAALLRGGTALTDRYIDYIQKKGFLGVYVSDEFSKDIELSEAIDSRVFQSGVEAVMEENVKGMIDVASEIVLDISSKANICTDLIDLRSFDDYTYHHSVNVAVYAVIVGKSMGLGMDELKLLAQAGLLHDIGKSQIPEEILNKPGRLNDEEYKFIQQHARFSYEKLVDNDDVSSIVRKAILFHHENENGSGYPYGKEGDEIGTMGRIIHTVDVYDALTSKRPYKEPYEPVRAFEYMRGGKDILFFEDAVDTLLDAIPAYPAGVDVYLSNGERGLVMDHSQNSLRPKIKLFPDGKNVDLATDPEYANVEISHSGILPLNSYQGQVILLNEERSAVKALRKNIMVVDSNTHMRLQLKSILEEEYNVTLFQDAMDAMNHLNGKVSYDLIITETNMKGIDGMSLVKLAREKSGREIPVIFFTGVNDRSVIVQCRLLGKSDYILKPAKPVYIRERIYAALFNID